MSSFFYYVGVITSSFISLVSLVGYSLRIVNKDNDKKLNELITYTENNAKNDLSLDASDVINKLKKLKSTENNETLIFN